MRYVLVNAELAESAGNCAFCPAKLEGRYVRDLGNGVVYCSHWCLEAHIFATQKALGGLDAPTPAVYLLPEGSSL